MFGAITTLTLPPDKPRLLVNGFSLVKSWKKKSEKLKNHVILFSSWVHMCSNIIQCRSALNNHSNEYVVHSFLTALDCNQLQNLALKQSQETRVKWQKNVNLIARHKVWSPHCSACFYHTKQIFKGLMNWCIIFSPKLSL